MTSVPSTTHLLLASALCAAACDSLEEAAVPAATPQVEATPADAPPAQTATASATPGPREAPAGDWTVQSHHPRLHQLDDDAWAEFSLEFLSGVVQTEAEADGLRLLSIGRGALVGQVGLLPGDVLLSVGSARPPSVSGLHDAWVLGQRTHWAEIERRREDTTETIFLWIRSHSTPQTVACSLVRLGVVQQAGGRRLIDRALLEALADLQWLYPERGLWHSLAVPNGGPILRVDDTNVGKNGLELALGLIAARADQRTFELVVGTDDGDARLQYEVVEGLLDPEALATIKSTPKPASAFRREAAANPPTTTLSEAVKKRGEHHYSIDRKRFEALLADPSTLARSARVVPSQKDGKTIGFKLYGIRRSSFLSTLGFQNGDLVLSVQGRDIAGVDEAMKAYTELSKSPPDTVRVAVVRRGTEVELKFDLE